jgi:ribosomal protein S18 acetylase RimI-like enzyme
MEVLERHDLDVSQIDQRLDEFNCQATGYHDGREFTFTVEEAGEVVGAASGYTWGGIGNLRLLWVSPDHRHRGLGDALLDRAIEHVRAQGCRHMSLDTHSFQAPAFYERHGFKIIATIEDKPLGHQDHIMRLTFGARP